MKMTNRRITPKTIQAQPVESGLQQKRTEHTCIKNEKESILKNKTALKVQIDDA
jgi:hypothetical protein